MFGKRKRDEDPEEFDGFEEYGEYADDDGYMPDDAASDGVHFGKKYCLIWLDYLAKMMEGQE